MKPKALLIGDSGGAFPLERVAPAVCAVFDTDLQCTCTGEYAGLTWEQLRQYDLLLCCVDETGWEEKSSARLAADLACYVLNGGGILGLHRGIATAQNLELRHLWGGCLQKRLPRTMLEFAPAADAETVLRYPEPFVLEEEPLLFTFDPFVQGRQILYTMTYGAQQYPAAWTLQYGSGRVAYVSGGQNPASFAQPDFVRLLRHCGLWAADPFWGRRCGLCKNQAEFF